MHRHFASDHRVPDSTKFHTTTRVSHHQLLRASSHRRQDLVGSHSFPSSTNVLDRVLGSRYGTKGFPRFNFNISLTPTSLTDVPPIRCFALAVSAAHVRGGLSDIDRRTCIGEPGTLGLGNGTGADISWEWKQLNNIDPADPDDDSGNSPSNSTTEAVLTLYAAQKTGVHSVPVSDIRWVGESSPVLRRQVYVGPANFSIPLLVATRGADV
jgi:hypothetical protein